MKKKYITALEFSEQEGINLNTVYSWINNKLLKATYRKRWLIDYQRYKKNPVKKDRRGRKSKQRTVDVSN